MGRSIPPLKICYVCSLEKPSDDFYKSTRDGLSPRCKACDKDVNREKARRLRMNLISDLGGKCICCNESTYEFLQIDHINNNGGEWKRQLGRTGAMNVSDLRRHIEDLQVLCANCHLSKSSWGRCPHGGILSVLE